MKSEEEFTALDGIVSLCVIALNSRNLSTRDHLDKGKKIFNEEYRQTGSLFNALMAYANHDFVVTLARATDSLSRFYDKIPERFMPRQINNNSLVGVCADVLNRIGPEYQPQ